jgi:hypothetical protein
MGTTVLSLQQYNSTTYVDQLAIQLGLLGDRLPFESADLFLDRLYGAAYARRDHTIEGVVNDMIYRLGLSVQAGVLITPDDPSTVVTVSAGRVVVGSVAVPTVTISPDDFWSWRMLSDVVGDINALTASSAVLQIPDAFAIQLVPQSSLGCSVAELVTGTTIKGQLEHNGVAVGTELFSTSVPPYILTTSGSLTFSATPPEGTLISYIYNLSPFTLTCSEVSVINLMDPALQTTAVCPDGSLVHQVQEFVQQILTSDPCYWGN